MPDHTPLFPSAAGTSGGVSIELDGVTKTYPGQAASAVEEFSMRIEPGELVVFVGPSGCGKTTTMKMVNRIIEPTSGVIRIDDRDVLGLSADQLRRHIGYVIQQIGLFPHLTIADNIATVPKLLGWDKARIRSRVEELMHTVQLDPAVFATRYPRQLSGGQQQRAGVARALAADPPVMLMDEPFGATDPITREKLQAEFLRLQAEIGKTIIFVTHDFEEALRLGDRIAVLGERSRIEQFDTPDAILAAPASDYVASFIGSGASLKRLALLPVGRADLLPPETDGPASGAARAAARPRIEATACLRDALDLLMATGAETLDVVGPGGTVTGRLDHAGISAALRAPHATGFTGATGATGAATTVGGQTVSGQ